MKARTVLPLPPPLFLTDADVRAVFDWRACVAALRKAYEAQADVGMVPARSIARGKGVQLRAMPAIHPDGRLMGSKQICASRPSRRSSYLISLYDPETAGLIALLDGTAITGGRTAATTALAVDALGINGPLTVGLLGSGFEAREHARALASLHGIASLTVFSPNPESRKAFADELGPELGIRIEPVKSPEEVLESASVLICAARSRDETPIFRGSKLPPATLVLSIGSTVPEQREIDADTVRRASVIFADSIDEVMESGDMVAARLAGVLIEDKIKSLADLVSGRTTVRQTGEGIVLYKSVGSALQDISVAAMCVERARERGLGTVLPCSIQVNQK